MCLSGVWWEEKVGWVWLVGPHSCLLPAARAEGQVAEVGGEGGEWAGHFSVSLEGIGGPPGLVSRWPNWGLRLRGSLVGNMVGT